MQILARQQQHTQLTVGRTALGVAPTVRRAFGDRNARLQRPQPCISLAQLFLNRHVHASHIWQFDRCENWVTIGDLEEPGRQCDPTAQAEQHEHQPNTDPQSHL